jgi:hypothetical protein
MFITLLELKPVRWLPVVLGYMASNIKQAGQQVATDMQIARKKVFL